VICPEKIFLKFEVFYLTMMRIAEFSVGINVLQIYTKMIMSVILPEFSNASNFLMLPNPDARQNTNKQMHSSKG
jgi:hypothetical protein